MDYCFAKNHAAAKVICSLSQLSLRMASVENSQWSDDMTQSLVLFESSARMR